MRELFMWGPNPNLDPETIWNYETGIIKTFARNKLQAEFTLFLIEGDNLIVNVGPPNGYLNSGKIENKGVEFAVRAEPQKNLSLEATYSYINMKEPVFATPKHHIFVNATYRLNKLQLIANLQHVSDLDTNPGPVANLESYTLLNAKAMYQLNSKLKLYVSGENLLNTNYEVNQYYTMPGTTVFAGLNITF